MNGLAGSTLKIIDNSIINDALKGGITGFHGVTERGTAEAKEVKSWPEYREIFGGLLADDLFPLICKRALDKGATLIISRAFHYTDVTDASSAVGAAATSSITDTETTPNSVNLSASSIGAWANGKLKVTVVAAASGVTGEIDITEELEGFPELTRLHTTTTAVADTAALDKLNERFLFFKIDAVTTVIPIGVSAAFASGAYNASTVVAADYIGDASASTGFRSLDNQSKITRVAVPAKSDPVIDVALAAYAEERGDILSLHRTPLGVNGTVARDYRNGTGSYTHTPIDSWRSLMFTGGVKINHPETGVITEIPCLGDLAGLMSTKEANDQAYLAFSGPKRGRVADALGVVYNFGSTSRVIEAGKLDAQGINPIIDHETYGPVFWGNVTMQRANTLLRHANVAELLIYMVRGLKPLIDLELFEPNDITTWQTIYKKVSNFMQGIQDGRGIFAFRYEGDQNVDDISEAVVNSSNDINAGKYKFKLFIQPTAALKYIVGEVTVTNAGISFDNVTEVAV